MGLVRADGRAVDDSGIKRSEETSEFSYKVPSVWTFREVADWCSSNLSKNYRVVQSGGRIVVGTALVAYFESEDDAILFHLKFYVPPPEPTPDAAYFYAPYIPLIITGVGPSTASVVSFVTRYGATK